MFSNTSSEIGLRLRSFDHANIGWELKEPVEYKFKEFPYYETRKNEALFREYVKACEQVTRRRNIL